MTTRVFQLDVTVDADHEDCCETAEGFAAALEDLFAVVQGYGEVLSVKARAEQGQDEEESD